MTRRRDESKSCLLNILWLQESYINGKSNTNVEVPQWERGNVGTNGCAQRRAWKPHKGRIMVNKLLNTIFFVYLAKWQHWFCQQVRQVSIILRPMSCSNWRPPFSYLVVAIPYAGVETLGPFPLAPRHIKFLYVEVDCFTKWI